MTHSRGVVLAKLLVMLGASCGILGGFVGIGAVPHDAITITLPVVVGMLIGIGSFLLLAATVYYRQVGNVNRVENTLTHKIELLTQDIKAGMAASDARVERVLHHEHGNAALIARESDKLSVRIEAVRTECLAMVQVLMTRVETSLARVEKLVAEQAGAST